MDDVTADPGALEVSAYRHVAKTEWGAAVVAWENDGKRGYQFEDGKLRVFKDGYYHLMEPVLLAAERGAVLLAQARRNVPGADKSQASAITVDRQIDHLLANYPGGFAGEKWQLEHRDGGKRPLKRHRSPAVARAQKELTRAQLDEGLAAADCHATWEALRGLLASTDLVSVSDTKLMAQVGGHAERAILERLRDLLWEEDTKPDRFDRWVGALEQGMRKPPSWPLATAPLALVHPDENVVIRPPSFDAQAAGLVPSIELRLSKRPNAGAYARALALATNIQQQLADRGVPAGDLIDVGDFIWTTLRPAARAQIEARMAQAWSDGDDLLPQSESAATEPAATEPAATEPAASEADDK